MLNPTPLIARVDALPAESPPNHTGTLNRRLLGPETTGGECDLFLATMQPGGEAGAHAHERAVQLVYVLEGQLELRLDGDPPRRCGPEEVLRIPPGLHHALSNPGPGVARALVAFTPPLPR